MSQKTARRCLGVSTLGVNRVIVIIATLIIAGLSLWIVILKVENSKQVKTITRLENESLKFKVAIEKNNTIIASYKADQNALNRELKRVQESALDLDSINTKQLNEPINPDDEKYCKAYLGKVLEAFYAKP